MKNLLVLVLLCLLCFAITAPALASSYLGNSKSLKFHYSDCRAAQKISVANRVNFSSAQEAIDAGYSRCGICKPH